MLRDAEVSVGSIFTLETCCDHLMIRGVDVEQSGSVPSTLNAGESFTWSTDSSIAGYGWQLCFSDPEPPGNFCDISWGFLFLGGCFGAIFAIWSIFSHLGVQIGLELV